MSIGSVLFDNKMKIFDIENLDFLVYDIIKIYFLEEKTCTDCLILIT